MIKKSPIANELIAAIACALLLATATIVCLVTGELGVGSMLACGAGGVATVALFVIWRTARSTEDRAIRQLQMLANATIEQLESDDLHAACPQARDLPRWKSPLELCYRRMKALSDEALELQQSRVRSEVKAHLTGLRHEQMREIVEKLSEPVLMTNQYDEIIFANEISREIFGITDLIEKKMAQEAIASEGIVQLLQETRLRKTPTQRVSEIELLDSTGDKHWYRITVSTIGQQLENELGADEPNFGAVAVLRDISGYKAIQRRNAEFVSAVSHEMKTPLAGIKAYVELLADGEAEDEQTRDEFLQVINSQADRLQRLIDNLLNLARIEAGVVNVNKKPRSLNELLEEAFRIVQPTAEQKNITLISDLSPMYLGVLVDRDMIMQAAINLLSNALKYTPDNGKVTLRSRMQDRDVVFEVEDTGVGLSPEDCDRVFEKFYRVKKDQKMASGTGLGLPLAKHIVEDVHGGDLNVTSEPGVGSTFRIRLPTVQVAETVS
ncbi:cell wall metabolism sensor histidine kinase WalK [Blastopirellula sp. JC732]|uniref:histidine kinase n=1 Tax=Blastopirellula sediminis TaxID=2894196 RepID=A0A9X1SIY8_9BACT|nr:PAS domain-containing sensor histidine kinase [Blastopirellula sediminis]MCC9604588.1 cell wall metabolism sensor histidine kinase WalK [Blastopirellula sediminis]MCC9632113.1 cell wall metabolism sensor histidine kinase WalK [Blastopirellula sediminis]